MQITLLTKDISRYIEIIIKCSSIIFFIGVWHWGSLYYHSLILPSPIQTLKRIYDIFIYDNGFLEIGITAARVIIGFIVSTVFAIILGICAGIMPIIRAFLHPLERLMISVPPVVWVVLTILWFGGDGLGSTVTTIAVSLFPIVYMSVLQGVKTIDTRLIDMGRSFGMSRTMVIIKIGSIHILSVAFPSLTITFGQSWKIGVMAEVLGASNGIGAKISQAQVNLETPDVFAWVSVAITLFIIADKLFIEPINKYSIKWR